MMLDIKEFVFGLYKELGITCRAGAPSDAVPFHRYDSWYILALTMEGVENACRNYISADFFFRLPGIVG